jgi:predicted DNA-binding antitoxin AbrB/MazE fold protein
MTKTIRAIYENQVLRLLEPLGLKDGQQVRIQILEEASQDEPSTLKEKQTAYVVAAVEGVEPNPAGANATEKAPDSIKALIEKLIREGRLRPRPSGPVPPDPVPEEERRALADMLGRAPGKPLSEIVIEERGEW